MTRDTRGQMGGFPIPQLIVVGIGGFIGLFLSTYLGLGEYPTVALAITGAVVLPFALGQAWRPESRDDKPDEAAGN